MQSFNVGGTQLRFVSDGILKTSVDCVLQMDRAQAASLAHADPDGSLYIPVNNFVFERDGKTLMIDAGAGNTMQPTLGKLPQNLRDGGIAPESITHIIITHIHPDHANGLVDDAGEPIYPNAEILVHAQEYDFWMAESDASTTPKIKSTRARNRINLKPYADRIRLMREGEEVLGCTPLLAPGHSPGHTCWRIGTGRDAFMAWGDLVHFSDIQIAYPNTPVFYDLDPDMARQSRLRMLDMIAHEKLAVAGAHVNEPGIGYLTRKGTSYHFEPVA